MPAAHTLRQHLACMGWQEWWQVAAEHSAHPVKRHRCGVHAVQHHLTAGRIGWRAPLKRACLRPQAASVVFPFLVDYDSAQSMVITNSEQQAVACCTLYPPMPDFPTEWSSLLESNSPTFGFTFLMQLYYSASMQKVGHPARVLGQQAWPHAASPLPAPWRAPC